MAKKRTSEEPLRARAARADWRAFPLRLPPELDAAVREIAERDVLAPSVNTVIVTLLQEALAARQRR